MKRRVITLIVFGVAFLVFAFRFEIQSGNSEYANLYISRVQSLNSELVKLEQVIKTDGLVNNTSLNAAISECRLKFKACDFWFRYLDPVKQKKINGPLPVEWEVEVFEKHEKPYRRNGYGLTLATICLDEDTIDRITLLNLITQAKFASDSFLLSPTTSLLKSPDHFFYCNRLFLLNLATIYTTGFECPNARDVIPELQYMLQQTKSMYAIFNESFSERKLSHSYLKLFDEMVEFVNKSPMEKDSFSHYKFIKNYVNPLFSINQQAIINYGCISKSTVDYAINQGAQSIFSKQLYTAQNLKGIYSSIYDKKVLDEIQAIGKSMFYDPVLSNNLQRSCASCHSNDMFFTDTTRRTAQSYLRNGSLSRNAPSLLNADLNQLLMWDGKHQTLQSQGRDVITNPMEMGSSESQVLARVLSCKTYKTAFNKVNKLLLPQPKQVSMDHITSAISMYYSSFSRFDSPFDRSMNGQSDISTNVTKGFNLFMGKAQCGTCHFAPHFNGVKPPYSSSEFEVLGTPEDVKFMGLSRDRGRGMQHDVSEMQNAFRTPSLKNAMRTKPYMHNGVFETMDQVLEFYNSGGGVGHHLEVKNQTLSGDSLRLSKTELNDLKVFLASLNEDVVMESPPKLLPKSKEKTMNIRKPGGDY